MSRHISHSKILSKCFRVDYNNQKIVRKNDVIVVNGGVDEIVRYDVQIAGREPRKPHFGDRARRTWDTAMFERFLELSDRR